MGTIAAATDGVIVGVAVTAKVLTENISMQATRARMKAFFIGLSFQQRLIPMDKLSLR
jgi:hypothetical protein